MSRLRASDLRPDRPLSKTEQRFVAEYVIDLNATQAAIRAGLAKTPAKGVVAGGALRRTPSVAQAIETALAHRAEICGESAERVLRDLRTAADLAMSHIDNHGRRDVSAAVKALELIGRHIGMFGQTTAGSDRASAASLSRPVQIVEVILPSGSKPPAVRQRPLTRREQRALPAAIDQPPPDPATDPPTATSAPADPPPGPPA